MTDLNREREKFEAWMIGRDYDVSRDAYGHYWAGTVCVHWEAWQEALAQIDPPKPGPEKHTPINPGVEGYEAYENGWCREDNPYDGGWEESEWDQGWVDSREDDQ